MVVEDWVVKPLEKQVLQSQPHAEKLEENY
jgi:hypothetical protein